VAANVIALLAPYSNAQRASGGGSAPHGALKAGNRAVVTPPGVAPAQRKSKTLEYGKH
jgi:hypothetical protein